MDLQSLVVFSNFAIAAAYVANGLYIAPRFQIHSRGRGARLARAAAVTFFLTCAGTHALMAVDAMRAIDHHGSSWMSEPASVAWHVVQAIAGWLFFTMSERFLYIHILTKSEHERAGRAQSDRDAYAIAQRTAILNSTPTGIIGIDDKAEIVFANKAAARMLGCQYSNLIGKTPGECFRAVSAIGDRDDLVGTATRLDGSDFPIRYSLAPIAGGGAVCSFTDISLERQREARQAVETALQYAVLHGSGAGILVRDVERQMIVFANRKAVRILGIGEEPDDVQGQRDFVVAGHAHDEDATTPCDLSGPLGDCPIVQAGAHDGHEATPRVMKVWRQDGSTVVLRGTAAMQGDLLIYSFDDITDELTTRRLQVESDRLLEREALAHDIHDGIIQQLYATGLLISAAVERSDLSLITSVVDRLNDAIAELRGFVFSLNPQAESLSRALHEAAKQWHVATSVEVDPAAAIAVAPRLHHHLVQIAKEAIANAARHSHADKISLSLARTNEELVLRVRDNGEGFDPSGVSPGGLNGMERRAEHIGGRLDVASTPLGVTITVRVPVQEIHA